VLNVEDEKGFHAPDKKMHEIKKIRSCGYAGGNRRFFHRLVV
jgi:hypothetical protein